MKSFKSIMHETNVMRSDES